MCSTRPNGDGKIARMKTQRGFALALTVLLLGATTGRVSAASEPSVSEYTKTARSNAISFKELKGEAAGFHGLFRGFGKYQLEHLAGDDRSWINVRFDGRTVDLYGATMERAGGSFPQKANDVVEWRGVKRNGRFEPYALIYRIEAGKGDTRKTQTRLIVIKLDGLSSAVIGHAQGGDQDAEARRIADTARPR